MKSSASKLVSLPAVQLPSGPEVTADIFLTESFTTRVKPTYGASAQTLYEDERAVLTVHRIDKKGAIEPEHLILFDHLLVQNILESTKERTQLVPSSGAIEKLYVFGREHRLFSVNAKLLDTDFPVAQEFNQSVGFVGTAPILFTQPAFRQLAIGSWDGRGLKAWKTFHDKYARLSVCADNRWICRLAYNNRLLYGAIVQNSRSMTDQLAHAYDLTFLFYAVMVQSSFDFTEGDFGYDVEN